MLSHVRVMKVAVSAELWCVRHGNLQVPVARYKVILDCLENIVRFYEKCGFRKYGISMRHDL